MPSRRRSVGQDHGNTPEGKGFVRHETSTGFVYFTRDDDPGYGYIIYGDNEGHPTGGAPVMERYPLAYILYVLGGESPIPRARDTQDTHNEPEVREATGVAVGGKIPLIYGEQRVGAGIIFGPRVNTQNAFRGYWYVGYAIAQGECDSLVKFELEPGKLATASPTSSYVSYNFHPGVLTPATANDPDPLLQQGTWGAGPGGGYEPLADMEIFPNLCYVGARFRFHEQHMSRYYERPLFTVRGRKLYDPRTGLTLWSTNPALALADYMANRRYGVGRGVSGVNWDSVAESANYCDVIVAGQKRHTLNIALIKAAGHSRNIATLRAHFRAVLNERDGKVVMVCDKAKASTFVFDGTNAQAVRFRRKGTGEVPNKVVVRYVDKARNYDTGSAIAETSGVTNGTEEARLLDIPLDGCDNQAEATRQAFYFLNKKLADLEVTLRGTSEQSSGVELLDRASYTPPSIGSALDLSVEQLQVSPDGHQLFVCSAYNAAILSDATAAIETLPAVALRDANAHLDPPTSPAIAVTFDQPKPGAFYPRCTITFVPYDGDFYGGTKVVYSIDGGADITHQIIDKGPCDITLADCWGKTIAVKLYTVNANTGVAGTTAATTSTPIENPNAPEPPSEFLGDYTTGYYFNDPPSTRAEFVLTAAMFSGLNLTTFVAANLVDDNEATTAVSFGASGTTRELIVNLGAAVAVVREFEWVLGAAVPPESSPLTAGTAVAGAGVIFYYSDVGTSGPWVQINDPSGVNSCLPHPVDRDYTRFIWQVPSALGSKRYFKWSGGGYQRPITEIRAYTATGSFAYAAGYLLTKYIGTTAGDTPQFAEAVVIQRPTSTSRIKPRDLEIIVRDRDSLYGGYESAEHTFAAFVQTVSVTGKLSAARMLFQRYVDASAPANANGVDQDYQVVNAETFSDTGTVNDLAITALTRMLVWNGTSPLTLTGIVAPPWAHARDLLIVNDGTAALTLPHQSASSVAGNRFRWIDAASRVLQPGESASLIYDFISSLPRWRDAERAVTYDASGNVNIGGTDGSVKLCVIGPGAIAAKIKSTGAATATLYLQNTARYWSMDVVGGGTFQITDQGSVRLAISAAGIVSFAAGIAVGSGGVNITAILHGSKTFDPPLINANALTTTTVAVTGAAVTTPPAKVLVSFSDAGSGTCSFDGYVSSANTVQVIIKNLDPTNAVNLGSGTLSVIVIQHA